MSNNPLDKPSVIIAAILGSAIGALFYNVLPLYLGMLQEYRGIDNVGIGFVGFIFFLGWNVITLSAFFWIRRFNWQVIAAICSLLAVLSLMVTAWLFSYYGLLLAVFVTGGACSGIYGLCTTVIGDTNQAARWFGLKIAAEGALGAILFLVLPSLVIADYGFNGLTLALGVVVLLLSPALFYLPSQGNKNVGTTSINHNAESSRNETAKKAIYLMLGATLLWFCGQTIMWSFVERIGSAAGHSSEEVGNVLAACLAAAMSGSIVATFIGDRFGTLQPFMISSALFLLACPVIMDSHVFSSYLIGATLVMFSVGLGIPYCFSIVAALDKDGRYTILAVPAIGVGMMVAPGLAGTLSADGSYGLLVSAAGLLVILGMGLSVLSLRSAKDHHLNSV